MTARRVGILAAALVVWLVPTLPTRAGHEFPFYPSYYPQEITLSVLRPAEVPAKLADGSLHAYLGADPFAGRPIPPSITRVESLGAYVVVHLNPASRFPGDAGRRCVAARAVAEGLAAPSGYRPLPYPVTPYHPDYLQHADLAAAARGAAPVAWDGAPLRVRAADPGAAALVPPALRAPGPDWDATVETVEIAPLWAAAVV